MRQARFLQHLEKFAGRHRLNRFPIDGRERIPGSHDVGHANVAMMAVIRGLQELHRPLALDVVRRDEPHDVLLLEHQQCTHSQHDHVAQRIIDLPVDIDGHRVLPAKVGYGKECGVARTQELTVTRGTWG
jgi:hypothetical protein